MQGSPRRASGRLSVSLASLAESSSTSPSRPSGPLQNTPRTLWPLTHSHQLQTRGWWKPRERGTAASRRWRAASGSPARHLCLPSGRKRLWCWVNIWCPWWDHSWPLWATSSPPLTWTKHGKPVSIYLHTKLQYNEYNEIIKWFRNIHGMLPWAYFCMAITHRIYNSIYNV